MGEQTKTYAVAGMSCEHCKLSVSEEIAEVEGVSGVDVDLAGGLVEVRGVSVSDERVEAAVEAAGYRIADR